MAELSRDTRKLLARAAVGALAILVVLGIQALLFHTRYAPRFEAANEQLFGLVVETAQRGQLRELGAGFDALGKAVSNTTDIERPPGLVWREFVDHYSAAPAEAIAILNDELPVITAGLAVDAGVLDQIRTGIRPLSFALRIRSTSGCVA